VDAARFMSPEPSINPLRAGIEAAKATFVPGLVVQAVMVLVVLTFYKVPEARPFFDRIAHWKAGGGLVFPFLSTMVAGGLLPELLRIVFFQRGRITRQNWANLAFALPYWGVQGIWVDLLYRGQALWFGNDAHFWTIVKKVCVDQFLYNPLLAAPCGVTLYEWKHRGYRWSREFLTWHWYGTRIVPGLIATWAVWIPVVAIVYCLPQTLQIPIFCLALTFWVTLFTWMTEILAPQRNQVSA
jgi:hypothetical protein